MGPAGTFVRKGTVLRSVLVGKKLTQRQIHQFRQRREQGELIKTLMEDYSLSKASVYGYFGTTPEKVYFENYPEPF